MGALFDALGRAKAAKKLVVLDACRSGKRDGARLLQSGFLRPFAGRGGVVAISGCGADQSSFEDEALGMGRLTKTIVDGIGGAAFEERQEFLFGHELWGYLVRTFHEEGWHTSQSPTMFGTWDARIRFDLARRDVAPPPAITDADRAMYDLAMKSAFDKVEADDLTACIEYCVTALRILDGDADALALRAFAYAMLGFYDRAQQDVDAVLAADPNNVYALVISCFVGDALGHFEVYDRDGTRALLLFRAHPERWVDRLPPKLASYVWVAYAVALGSIRQPPDQLLAAYDRVLGVPRGQPEGGRVGAHLSRRTPVLVRPARGRARRARRGHGAGRGRSGSARERQGEAREVPGPRTRGGGRARSGLGARERRRVPLRPGPRLDREGGDGVGGGERRGGARGLQARPHPGQPRGRSSTVGGLRCARIFAHLGRNEDAVAAYGRRCSVPDGFRPGDRAWAGQTERGPSRWSRARTRRRCATSTRPSSGRGPPGTRGATPRTGAASPSSASGGLRTPRWPSARWSRCRGRPRP